MTTAPVRAGAYNFQRTGETMKILTIRLPLELWKALRNLQTDGKIKSIQQAVVLGLQKVVKENS